MQMVAKPKLSLSAAQGADFQSSDLADDSTAAGPTVSTQAAYSDGDCARLIGQLAAVLASIIQREVQQALAGAVQQAQHQEAPRLGLRQAQVLSHLQRGLTNKEIAREIGISEDTVKVHVRYLCKKYSVTNRLKLVIASLEARA